MTRAGVEVNRVGWGGWGGRREGRDSVAWGRVGGGLDVLREGGFPLSEAAVEDVEEVRRMAHDKERPPQAGGGTEGRGAVVADDGGGGGDVEVGEEGGEGGGGGEHVGVGRGEVGVEVHVEEDGAGDVAGVVLSAGGKKSGGAQGQSVREEAKVSGCCAELGVGLTWSRGWRRGGTRSNRRRRVWGQTGRMLGRWARSSAVPPLATAPTPSRATARRKAQKSSRRAAGGRQVWAQVESKRRLRQHHSPEVNAQERWGLAGHEHERHGGTCSKTRWKRRGRSLGFEQWRRSD